MSTMEDEKTDQDGFYDSEAEEFELVEAIPATIRVGAGGPRGERNTKIKRFYDFLTSKPVGTVARFATGVRSPNYGAKDRYPNMKVTSRQTGSTQVVSPEDGSVKIVKVYDLYGTHVAPASPGEAPAPPQEDDGLV